MSPGDGDTEWPLAGYHKIRAARARRTLPIFDIRREKSLA